MHIRNCFIAALFLGVVASLSAQARSDTSAMTNALKLRAEMAGRIVNASEKTPGALLRLKAQSSPTGLKIASPEADFAYAAIDVAYRLVALHRPIEAEDFFKAAEESLVLATKQGKVADSEKARYLRQLAVIRADYLNKAVEAKEDIEAAIALQPDDQSLKAARRLIASGNNEIFRDRSNH